MTDRLGLSPEAADRYLVTWAADDLASSLKQALRVRKFRLRLDYTTHTPMLFIVNAQGKEFLWRILDTRKWSNGVVILPEKAVNEQAFADHVGESLEKLGFKLLIGHRRKGSAPGVKKDEAILMLVSDDSRHWVLSVVNVQKGGSKTIHGEASDGA
jgi:hypothetical protein